jgi:hypothetical protein
MSNLIQALCVILNTPVPGSVCAMDTFNTFIRRNVGSPIIRTMLADLLNKHNGLNTDLNVDYLADKLYIFFLEQQLDNQRDYIKRLESKLVINAVNDDDLYA